MTGGTLERVHARRMAAMERGEKPDAPDYSLKVLDGGPNQKKKKNKRAPEVDEPEVEPSVDPGVEPGVEPRSGGSKKRRKETATSAPLLVALEGAPVGPVHIDIPDDEEAVGEGETSAANLSVVDKGKGPADGGDDFALCWRKSLDFKLPEFARLVYGASDTLWMSSGDAEMTTNELFDGTVRRALQVVSVLAHVHQTVYPQAEAAKQKSRDLDRALAQRGAELEGVREKLEGAKKELEEAEKKLAAAEEKAVEARQTEEENKQFKADLEAVRGQLEERQKEVEKGQTDAQNLKTKLEESERIRADQLGLLNVAFEQQRKWGEERKKYMGDIADLENDLDGITDESFQNAVAQLCILHPGLCTDGISSDFCVRNGEICIMESRGVYFPVKSSEGEALIARRAADKLSSPARAGYRGLEPTSEGYSPSEEQRSAT